MLTDDRKIPDIDRTGDYGGRWRGKVINVMDPKRQGRIQVRVVGLHDNETLIPDKDLPWALPRVPINAGASYRGVSGSPVGVIPGSIVDGYFADRQRTILIVTGTLQSAGRTKEGETINGSYALDSAYNDLTDSSRGTDLNAALGLKNYPALSQIGAVFPHTSAGVGNLPIHTGNILSILSSVDPRNISGTISQSVTGFIKAQAITQLGSLGSIGSIAQKLSAVQSGIVPLTSLSSQLQSVATGLGNVSSLISIARSISSNPGSLLQGGIGGIMNRALSIASGLGSASILLNKALGTFSIVSQQRQFSLEASEPTPPPVPEAPTTTSSKAATSASTKSAGTDPYAMTETYDLLPVVINSNVADANIEGKPVTTGELLGIASATELDTTAENENILKQIGNNADTQAAASADVRSTLENRLSPKDRAAQQRAINTSGGIF